MGVVREFFMRGDGKFDLGKLSRRSFDSRMVHRFLIATLILCFLAAASTMQAEPPSKPNVIFILADDLGYGDLSCYGQGRIQSPRIDQMAAEGMRFTQFYAGSTVCAPSRSVLMTGLHTGHTRVRGNAGSTNPVAQMLKDEDVTVAEVAKGAGYATGLIGKWGLGMSGDEGVPNKQGFDYFYGYLSQHHAHNHFPDFLWRNESKVPLSNVVVPVGDQGGGYATKRVEYSGDLFAEEAVAFVDQHKDEPFFLYLAFVVPHANNERTRALGDGQEVPDYGIYEDKDWPNPDKGQAAMITRMDTQIGALLDRLKKHGIDEKTLVMFSSDNGPHKEGGNDPEFFDANGPVRGIKRDLTDGGIRVPFIARWPGVIEAGQVSGHVGFFGDIMPTVAELSGGEMPNKTDGISLVPLLTGDKAAQREHSHLYWEFHERSPSQAVILEGRWKGIRKPKEGTFELYDLKADVGEETNLASEKPELVAKLSALMDESTQPNEYWDIRSSAAKAGKKSTATKKK